MNKKVLITGGLGFIGVHCIEKWLTEKFEVFVIDNLTSNAVNIDHDIAKKVNLTIKNVLDVKWENLPKFDLILHLASPVGPVGVLKHAGNMAKIILEDIYWVIEGAKQNKCPLIFISTSEIYGHRSEKSYLKEQDDKVLHGSFTVRNEYSMSKLLSEIVLTNQGKIHKYLKYQIVRPFNVTGMYQLPDGGFVLPRFVSQALKNEDITVYYSGKQLRSFTWVKDIVEGIYLTASTHDDSLWNQEWNIGNKNNEKTILYLAEKVKELTKSDSKIVHIDPVKLHGHLFSEAPEKIPNSDKIEKLLAWAPSKDVDAIIKEVIDFYQTKQT